jgi:hypothetical protein
MRKLEFERRVVCVKVVHYLLIFIFIQKKGDFLSSLLLSFPYHFIALDNVERFILVLSPIKNKLQT